ncbi:AAA family ATPase [Clostridiaceae bacterium UIB06]|uniref:AAA family ATPase n=1 Tax=Clostridium thailandense TaxID=2794346 RepID=A0A949TG80_9CLOT|nr:AAA family ATPase [Clostridium thailandense]MBV7271635.1 AAA family ATPase [Clostridium thailandense]MCH5136395.1 AAA family ATPase [Clostridiaceae bacterium UIB06]
MKIVSLFNNKGGVGKSTLGYHLGHALSEMGKRVLLVDLDPQCNLTISGLSEEMLHGIWLEEDPFIDDFADAIKNAGGLGKITSSPRSIHFLLKPAEDGLNELEEYPKPFRLSKNLDLIPGRLSIHKYENKIAERWSGAYQSDNLSIRTITNIRRICEKYDDIYSYDYIIIDTSPSLGILNKVIISTVDGFFIPAQPDMFSLYGIRNIGNSLEQWQKEFNTIYSLISSDKRRNFPNKFVQFIGYTIYNAKKYTKKKNKYDLASAHYSYVKKIPEVIDMYINHANRADICNIMDPIGEKAVMHTHNTFPSVAQALKCPMWNIPEVYHNLQAQNQTYLAEMELEVNSGHFPGYRATRNQYIEFAKDFIKRAEVL